MASALRDRQTTTFSIANEEEVGAVRRHVTGLADTLGFDTIAAEELSIVVSEMGFNLVTHRACEGHINIRPLDVSEGGGIEIISSDVGPGIADLGLALQDGFSTSGSMGCGFGAMRRLSDEFDIFSCPELEYDGKRRDWARFTGTHVIARKYISKTTDQAIVHSSRSQPITHGEWNGDGYFFKQKGQTIVVGVSDGLGHGPKAHAATKRVLETLDDVYLEPLEQIFETLHKSLHQTRGAAVSLVRIDLEKGTLTHGGLGNVTTKWVLASSQTLFTTPGVCGLEPFRIPKMNTVPWYPGCAVFIYSDGLASKWDVVDYPEFRYLHPALVTFLLMTRLSRKNDDATVVLVREERNAH